jgi:acetyl-CoA C-acetyltransferase
MGAVVGSEPLIMLEGPIPATKKALRNAKMNAGDIDLLRLMKLCSGSNAYGSFNIDHLL